MADLAQLTRWRDALMAARYQGVRTVEYDGHRVTNATDTEMAAVLGDLERRIAEYGGKRVSVVRIQSSKGFWPKKTFIQPGDVITATAPTGSVASSDGIIVGSQFGVAAVTTAEGGSVEVATTGVHKLPKLILRFWNGASFLTGRGSITGALSSARRDRVTRRHLRSEPSYLTAYEFCSLESLLSG